MMKKNISFVTYGVISVLALSVLFIGSSATAIMRDTDGGGLDGGGGGYSQGYYQGSYVPTTQCNDGLDNDGNGPKDYPTDLGCTSGSDTSEAGYSPAQCQDTLDNDNDGRVDLVDTGCTAASDTSEQPDPECSDAVDNDLNGVKDYSADQGCSSATDNDESGFTPPAVPGAGIVVYATQSKRDYYYKVKPDQLANGGVDETAAHGYPIYPVTSVSPTGQRICYLYDPTAYPTEWSLGGFDSAGDNSMAAWNPTSSRWYRASANSFGNKRYNYITCKTKAPPDVALSASDADLKITAGQSVTLTWFSQYGALRKGSFSSTNFDTSILIPGHWETQVSYPLSCSDTGGFNDGTVMVSRDAKVNLALPACGTPEVQDVWVPDYNGPRPYGGTKSVSPSTTTTYTYTGTNSNGSNTASITIQVAGTTECTDLIDNGDGDGLIDGADTGCITDPPGPGNPDEHSDLPDLTAGAVTQSAGTQGSATTLSATITNIGGSATSAGFTNLFQIDDNADHATVYATNTDTSPAVAKNGTDLTQVSYTFPTAGTWYVRVCADNNASWVGTVSEYNESNNCDAAASVWHAVVIASNAPTASLSASPTGVPKNDSSTLTWTCTNSTSASINQGIGAVTPVAGGSVSTGPLSSTKSFTLTCTGSSGAQGFATVSVTQPVVTITATPVGLAKKGATKLITWTSSADATSCVVSGPGLSSTLKNSSQSVTIADQSTYTITCNGSTASVTVGLAPVFQEI